VNPLKTAITNKLRQIQLESQTFSLKNAPLYIKILAFVYKVIGRRTLAKSLVTSLDCNLCNTCVKYCPNKAIAIKNKNIIRNKQCKGCLICVYSCPKKTFYLPVINLAGIFILIFLPYEKWLFKLFNIDIATNYFSIKYIALNLGFWTLGYVISIFIFMKIMHYINNSNIFKIIENKSSLKKIRNKIHPAQIFPVIIPANYKNLF